ncbi:sporulation protein YjcZ [Bacillus cereus]|uniref:YjcZ family sporulation protein n=1 Tax=Bacillus TaxID=1386 RepID=UPI0004796DDA|nr:MULTISPECIES: YjcZ family sporulation protein [Bacillus]PFE05835.1 sporulation protein YjcZ [Bacillus sp. AFS023182]PGY04298.1 sporulation protein YjcZ [Bacillus cereus]WIY60024.1 YjcZ family sporulation protein [Bacillus arachidis]
MYGYTYCYPTCSYPSYGYGGSYGGYGGSCGGCGYGRGFALIVVLFILLIIVGAACIR